MQTPGRVDQADACDPASEKPASACSRSGPIEIHPVNTQMPQAPLRDIEIKIPYTTSPQMASFAGPPFQRDPDVTILQEKRVELSAFGHDLHGMVDAPVSRSLVQGACAVTDRPVTDDIVEFALQFEEDVALMHDGRLQCICFCFPSSWIPRSRLGCRLEEIHAPVGDGDRLVQASPKIAQAMSTMGPFRRHVWTLAMSGDRSQHPARKPLVEPQGIEQLWFRVETQTTLPLGDGQSSLFFVKVDAVPLQRIFEDRQRARRICDSVFSMSDAILDYKGLAPAKKVLEDYALRELGHLTLTHPPHEPAAR